MNMCVKARVVRNLKISQRLIVKVAYDEVPIKKFEDMTVFDFGNPWKSIPLHIHGARHLLIGAG